MELDQADADLYRPLLSGDSTVLNAVFERYGAWPTGWPCAS